MKRNECALIQWKFTFEHLLSTAGVHPSNESRKRVVVEIKSKSKVNHAVCGNIFE